MIALQLVLSLSLLTVATTYGLPAIYVMAAPALALCIALGAGSLAKSRLLSTLLDSPVNSWRWTLLWAIIPALVIGLAFLTLPRSMEWAQLVIGMPLILCAYAAVIWFRGFGPDDRALFQKQPAEPAVVAA